MSDWHFTRPPKAMRRAKLDNLAIVPASLLPLKMEWQAVVNRLPEGGVLIILPSADAPSRKTLERVVSLLEGKGHEVITLLAERFNSAA